MKNKCVFLDRDGVLNADEQYYTYRLEDVILLDGVPEALRLLKEAGYLLIVITNQAGIAKGDYEAADVRAVHQLMQELCGVTLDDLYFSPHHPDYSSQSLRRKPDSLMIEKAMAKHRIDPAQSWMIGDRMSDVEAGKKAGVRTVLIRKSEDVSSEPDFQAADLLTAAKLITSSVETDSV
ncbi:D-glycero-alpha-D-manno-heptose-1,7-bisphosphate 7-phosphatase [Arundinibacter roseus]|uniref:D,D-heptose 1,7-bisphosphate phosphatase n=1 Tax=Arundinibacter roseus TaxID=2070510 RepID=A0A4R4K0K1_9BACT|nr:HAD family hydrolase [Arundinibacter roseus]TDB60797.1 HAD family hydrolase [Arundinibacter roseus]